MYRLFYDYEVNGDTLFVVFEAETKPDKVISNEGVTALYREGRLIGYNVFEVSKVVKLKSSGMIVTPEDVLVNAINVLLENAGFEKLPYCESSGYLVGKVIKVEEHPLDSKRKIIDISFGDKGVKETTTRYDVNEGDFLVCVLDDTIKFDGTTFHASIIKNIPQDAEVLSSKELKIGEENHAPFHPEGYNEGEDFFLGGNR